MSVSQRFAAFRRRTVAAWLSVVLPAALSAFSGCGQSDRLPHLTVYEVTGKVVLADGKPLSSGVISFVPKGDLPITPSANISPDGTFKVITGGSGDGAPPGDYKVRIEAPALQSGPKSKKSLFPFKYTDEDSSEIVVTVRPQENHLDPIVLK